MTIRRHAKMSVWHRLVVVWCPWFGNWDMSRFGTGLRRRPNDLHRPGL
jgi:hypothetical protein